MRKDIQQMLDELNRATERLPVDQFLSELQLIIERISFSQLHLNRQQQVSVTIAQIDMLFQGEISTEMLGFVQWLREANLLHVIADKPGLLFLNYCIKKYKGMTQVRFVSAVSLDTTLRDYVWQSILKLYPANTRLIFEVNPSLVAGFIIEDGAKTVDKSLRSQMVSTLRTRIQQTTLGAARG